MCAGSTATLLQHLSSCVELAATSLCVASVALLKKARDTGLASRSSVGNARMALILPTLNRSDYIQPLLRELTKIFPQTMVLVGEFPGFLPTCQDSFEVKVLPGTRNFIQDGEICFRWLPVSLIRELHRARPDIIVFGQFTMWSFYAVLYKLFHRSRLLFLWDGTAPGCAYTNSPLRLAWRRFLARFVDGAISNTQEGIEYLSQIIHVARSKIRHGIYLVPDLDSLRYDYAGDKPVPSNGCRPVFLFVGSLSKRKGVRYLVEAVKKLKEQELTKFSVILVGEGEQEDLRKTISGELENIVQIVGSVKYPQLGMYYHNCDAFILPSMEDVWGMVVPEAMAFGKAILCSKYANAKELLQHGVNGFIFDPRNPAELASYMAEIIRQPQLSTQFGHASRAAISDCNPKNAARLIADVAAELLRVAH
jgi:glycosyltransferase involved in cell wall biosynthesis